ncbi:MAG: type II toxin-antitoxin system Phd/YefM family antitoxin [Anaerolineae bacterium]|nr:type II toxin-antitoxin system Phd/YefM family antitoxin [Anaerolineae bacterium]
MATMSFTRTISATDFRHRLKAALDEVDRSGDFLVITRRGEPRFVVLTLDSYENLIDAKLVASPLLQKRLSEARAHYAAGEGGSYEVLRQELLEESDNTDAS